MKAGSDGEHPEGLVIKTEFMRRNHEEKVPKTPVRHRPGIGFFLGLSLGLGRHLAVGAQGLDGGVPAVFRTGTTPERITQSLTFSSDVVGAGPAQLGFEIGFSTEETILDSGFLDSFTLSGTGGAQGDTAVLLTLDGFGSAPLPESPGALLLAPSSLRLTPIIGQFTAPNAQTTLAFSGVWDLPREFQNHALTLTADLFANGNERSSLGYLVLFRPQAVPEPTSWALGGFGIGLGLLGLVLAGKTR